MISDRSLLLLALLSLLLLLGEELADLLVPFPFALNISSSVFHVHLLLALSLELLLSFLLLSISLTLQLNLSLYQLVHMRNLFVVVLTVLVNLLTLLLKSIDPLLAHLVLLIGLLREQLCLSRHELPDALADEIFSIKLLLDDDQLGLQRFDLLLEHASLA